MLKLKDIAAKSVADLTVEEKAFLVEHAAELNAEETEKFSEVLSEGGVDIDKAMELVSKKFEKLAGELGVKLLEGAAEQRAQILHGASVDKSVEADKKTRAFVKAVMNGDTMGAKALTTNDSGTGADDSQAGLLIPQELMTEVLRISPLYGVARRDMFYLPFSGPGNTRAIPALGTSVSVKWTGEKEKKTSTQPKFIIVTQTLKKLAAIVPFTDEILEDSAINLTSLIATLFAEAVGVEEDAQFFAGTGAPWTGIVNDPNVNKVVSASGDVNQVTVDDLIDLEEAVPSGAPAGSKYYFNRTVLGVLRKLKDKNGNYILMTAANGQPATLNGYPYETLDAMPLKSGVTTGEGFVIFGNLKKAAIFGDKQQLRVKLLDQATITDTDGTTVINLAEQDMSALRVVERVGYVLALPKAVAVLVAAAHVGA